MCPVFLPLESTIDLDKAPITLHHKLRWTKRSNRIGHVEVCRSVPDKSFRVLPNECQCHSCLGLARTDSQKSFSNTWRSTQTRLRTFDIAADANHCPGQHNRHVLKRKHRKRKKQQSYAKNDDRLGVTMSGSQKLHLSNKVTHRFHAFTNHDVKTRHDINLERVQLTFKFAFLCFITLDHISCSIKFSFQRHKTSGAMKRNDQWNPDRECNKTLRAVKATFLSPPSCATRSITCWLQRDSTIERFNKSATVWLPWAGTTGGVGGTSRRQNWSARVYDLSDGHSHEQKSHVKCSTC